MRNFAVLFALGTLLYADPCSTAGTRALLAPAAEPGRRMVVSGRVFLPDGRTPAAGVTLYAYQTDSKGEYGTGDPRLRGWMKTDAEGRYEIESVRPGPYPGGNVPAHVHFQVWSATLTPRYAQDLLFDDDPLVKAADRDRSRQSGQFDFVKRGEAGAGVLRLTFDIRIPAQAPTLTGGALHGVRACRQR